MNFLEKKILSDGVLKEGNILKVTGFLNHLIDVNIVEEIANAFLEAFHGEKITKILTIEASGIPIAMTVALKLHVPMLFAKKTQSLNVDGNIYSAKAYSFTHKCDNQIFVSSGYLSSDDRVLIVDDFLANGEALKALISVVQQAGAQVVGCGIAIEKGFQGGGDAIRAKGYKVKSIAIIDKMDYNTQKIEFRQQNQ